mmetsp:Transcript_23863/g.37397  ORF Transcript_23863/g.37397 Transcript_23863/m.37397 type:complete len:80 (+) Transcript_23863:900-1139(+)
MAFHRLSGSLPRLLQALRFLSSEGLWKWWRVPLLPSLRLWREEETHEGKEGWTSQSMHESVKMITIDSKNFRQCFEGSG